MTLLNKSKAKRMKSSFIESKVTGHQSPLLKARKAVEGTYNAVFNAVCDCGPFMAAFGSDISSELS